MKAINLRRSAIALLLCICTMFGMVAMLGTRAEAATVYKDAKGKTYSASQVITFIGKPSCWRTSKCYNVYGYKWVTKTWVNKCAYCGGKLYNAHKRVSRYELELTCKKCDADYCAACGYEKIRGSSKHLTAVTKVTGSSSGSSTTQNAKTVTYANVISAAATLADYVDSNKKLPASVKCGNTTLKLSDFLYLGSQVIVKINAGTKSGSLTIPSTKAPSKPSGKVSAYNMLKSEYVQRAKNIISFMDKNSKTAPNYVTVNKGTVNYRDAVYYTAKILRYYNSNKALPNYCYVKQWNLK